MKKTPCFNGVVKSIITLNEYCRNFECTQEIKKKLKIGLEYILQHYVFKRLSSDQPVEDSIILNFYPFTYKTNIIEILNLLNLNNLLEDPRCKEAINLLIKRQRSDGFWQSDTSFMKTSWINFDKLKSPGLGITNYILQFLNTWVKS